MLLRIEDTDRERSTDAAIEAILDGLSWLGLQWDGEVVRQFARAPGIARSQTACSTAAAPTVATLRRRNWSRCGRRRGAKADRFAMTAAGATATRPTPRLASSR
jgi:hypothetical protein